MADVLEKVLDKTDSSPKKTPAKITPNPPPVAAAKNTVPVDRETAPRQAKKIAKRAPPKPVEPPDLVRVRAIEKGFYGLDLDIIIRNPGEVFDMATQKMRRWPLEKGEHPTDQEPTIIETERGTFELPGWVELAEDADMTESAGHPQGIRGQTLPDGSHHISVL